MKKKFTKILTLLLTVCLLTLSFPFSLSADDGIIADDIVTVIDETELLDDYSSNYVEGEVIIMLADTPETENLQLYSIYSDDFLIINQEANEKLSNTHSTYSLNNIGNITVAGSSDSIEDILDLGINISEMKLLNPSRQDNNSTVSPSNSNTTNAVYSNNGLYTVNDNNNNIFSIKLEGVTVAEAISVLSDNSLIRAAEPNYIGEFFDIPNDSYYSAQYALDKIKASGAWETTTGSSSVVVGIIDTGIDGTHPDLIDNLWSNPYFSELSGCSVCGLLDDKHGYNFTGDGTVDSKPCGGTPTDLAGHGTHVAGIVGAKGNNNTGVCGVSWNVSLAWLGISCGESMTIRDAITALNYAENHGITITNNSYGFRQRSCIFEDAIYNYNGLFVACAGNFAQNIDYSPLYPACFDCPNIITVAATDSNNNLSDFENDTEPGSNYGVYSVDVAAPGSAIISTDINNELYKYRSGTSMAAPYVAGIAALIKSNNPSFTPLQIKAAICGTVQQLGKLYAIAHDGGIVNAEAAVEVTSNMLKSVTYDNNYLGSPAPFVDYTISGKRVRPPALTPIRDGYVFDGWYTSPTGGVPFNYSYSITTNITLYARWVSAEENSYGAEFPDYNFREFVLSVLNGTDNGDRTVNTPVSTVDQDIMRDITTLSISSKNIRDLTGLLYFTNLTSLNCESNKITELDLSGLYLLEYLRCSYNALSELDLTGLSNIKNLYCHGNRISNLNLDGLTKVEWLWCNDNYLTSIDLSSCAKLIHFKCDSNFLINLDLSDSSQLAILDCSGNNLISLNLSTLYDLENINCSRNHLTSLSIDSAPIYVSCRVNDLNSLRIYDTSSLIELNCSSNNLKIIDIRGTNKEPYDLNLLYLINNDFSDLSDVLGSDFWDGSPVVCFHPQSLWATNPFIDVSSTDIFYKAVEYMVSNGYMSGSLSSFLPNNTISRRQMVMAMYAMAGRPDVSTLTIPFTDVTNSDYSYNAVKWAYNNGIVSGTTATTFSPHDPVARKTAALMLNKFAQYNNWTMPIIREYMTFADESSISSWAKESVQLVYKAGIMNHYLEDAYSNYYFAPNENITRGDLAIVLRKFDVTRLYF